MAMKMAPVLMKIAPRAIPRPGRVPERSFCPRIWTSERRRHGTFRDLSSIYLGFTPRGLFMVEKAAPEGSRGGLATPRRGQILI